MPWNDPLLPKSWIQPVQDYLEEPSLEQSPTMAAIKGFGSGALEGLRSLTTPSALAGMAAGPMMKAATGVAAPAASVYRPAMSVMRPSQGVTQAMPKTADVDLIINSLKRSLKDVPSSLGGETGAIDTETLVKGGLGLGAAAYGLPKAYQAAKDFIGGAQEYNPFGIISDKLEQATRGRRR